MKYLFLRCNYISIELPVRLTDILMHCHHDRTFARLPVNGTKGGPTGAVQLKQLALASDYTLGKNI